MTIACLGWGSLIWRPEALPVTSEWYADKPPLPIEFTRQSNDGRITLVIVPEAAPIPVLWCKLGVPDLGAARAALADREGIKSQNAGRLIGSWPNGNHAFADQIGCWAAKKKIDGIVWTALRPRFGGKSSTPTCDAIVAYLRGLGGETREHAETYVRKAPAAIRTAYRTAIEEALGWTPIA